MAILPVKVSLFNNPYKDRLTNNVLQIGICKVAADLSRAIYDCRALRIPGYDSRSALVFIDPTALPTSTSLRAIVMFSCVFGTPSIAQEKSLLTEAITVAFAAHLAKPKGQAMLCVGVSGHDRTICEQLCSNAIGMFVDYLGRRLGIEHCFGAEKNWFGLQTPNEALGTRLKTIGSEVTYIDATGARSTTGHVLAH